MLKSEGYDVAGCDHNDITLSNLKQYQKDVSAHYHTNLWRLLGANNPTQFKDRCLNTKLCKQTIFSGLHNGLEIPNMFLLDIL